jgi:hypothetical protein
VPSQELHVSQRPANRADLPGGGGDEPAPAAMARAAVEPQGSIPDGEQVHDRRGAGLPGSFRRDHEERGPAPDLSLLNANECRLLAAEFGNQCAREAAFLSSHGNSETTYPADKDKAIAAIEQLVQELITIQHAQKEERERRRMSFLHPFQSQYNHCWPWKLAGGLS